jgi:hypothetical protein
MMRPQIAVAGPDVRVVHILRTPRDTPGLVYVGRPNRRYKLAGHPLANPFRMRVEADRPRIIIEYERWLPGQLANNPVAAAAMEELARIAAAGPLLLGCWCAPKDCHARPIRDRLVADYLPGRLLPNRHLP